MDTQIEKPAMTQTKCFRDDTARIKALGDRLEASERTGFSSQHVISRALDALAEKLGLSPDSRTA